MSRKAFVRIHTSVCWYEDGDTSDTHEVRLMPAPFDPNKTPSSCLYGTVVVSEECLDAGRAAGNEIAALMKELSPWTDFLLDEAIPDALLRAFIGEA